MWSMYQISMEFFHVNFRSVGLQANIVHVSSNHISVKMLYEVYYIIALIWASQRENLSLGYPAKSYLKQPAQLQRLWKIEACLDMTLSNKQITKALTRLRAFVVGKPQSQGFSHRGPLDTLVGINDLFLFLPNICIVILKGSEEHLHKECMSISFFLIKIILFIDNFR